MTSPVWPLVVYFVLAVALVAALVALSHVLGERHAEPAQREPFESGVVIVGSAHLRFSAKYYLIAMFFVIFDVEALFLYAWAVAVREAGWPGYAEALVFILVYMDASRLSRTSPVWCWTGIGCSFISGLLCRLDGLLALMGSADPRLISPMGSKP